MMFEKFPVVSVIVPAFNSEKTIELTVTSILSQTFSRIEVIIVDDGSCDGTSEKCIKMALLDNRIRLHRFDSPSGGPARPRNYGISVAKGDWVAFCDSDDMWNSKKIETQIQVSQDNQESILCTGIRVFGGDDKVNPSETIKISGLMRYDLSDMLKKNRVATSSTMIKRGILNQAGNFDESRSLIAIEDYDMWLRVLSIGNLNVCMINAPLTYYRSSKKSISANKVSMLIKVANLLWRKSVYQKNGVFLISWTWCIVCYCFLSIKNRLIQR